MRRSRPLLAFLVFCISILIIIALLQTLVYQSPTPPPPLEKPWVDGDGGGDGDGDGNSNGTGSGIIEWCKDSCLAPSEIDPTDRELVFSVSPASPKLYWKVFTADEYTGFGWRRSTQEDIVDEFPSQAEDDEYIFTVELNTTAHRLSLPIPPPPSSPELSRPNLAPSRNFALYLDQLADVYGIEITDPANKTNIDYQATWHHVEINESKISLTDIPQEIHTTYLQLPEGLPSQVRELAYELENSSLSVFDQIFADMRYLMTNFTYDIAFKEGKSNRTIDGDWVLSYMKWGKGICSDAATALTVILRCQSIPARINLGFKPGNVSENNVLYFSTGAHAETEAYLPPYGWVRFDATPPCRGDGLLENYSALRPPLPRRLIVEINPKETEGEPRDRVVFYVTVNNTGLTDNCFSLYACTELGWNITVRPENLTLEPFGEGQFLVEVTIPGNATVGQICGLNVTATCSNGEQASVSTSIEVVEERILAILEIYPEAREGQPGERLLFHMMVNNTGSMENPFELCAFTDVGWNVTVYPGNLTLEPLEKGEFLVEVIIPGNATVGQICGLNVTCTGIGDGKASGSALIKVVKGEPIPTVTSITYVPKDLVLRPEDFYIEGNVKNLTDEPVPAMPVFIYLRENKEVQGTLCGQGFSQENGSFYIKCSVPSDFEVGTYCVVAHSAGTAIYAPSESDPSIKIGARTSIELHIQKSILVNEKVTISGRLVDDNKTSIRNASIKVKIRGEEMVELLTNDHGEFTTTYQFTFNGTFAVNATFSGTEYFQSSSKPTSVNVYVPVIETSMNYLVRGEQNEIQGIVTAGNAPVEGRMIAIGLDDRILETVKTGSNGGFEHVHFVDYGESLDQPHTLSFTLLEIGTSANKPVKIMAMTRLDMSVPQEVPQGGFFTFATYLFDDQGLPIMNGVITADGLSERTQRDGKVEFSKYASLWLWFRDINLTCHFEGSEKYLPSEANAIVVTQPNFLLFILPSAVVVSAVSAYLIHRRRLGRTETKDKENLSEPKVLSKEEMPPPAPTKSPLNLVFPDIPPPFPYVWGVGEDLRIKSYLNTTVINGVKGSKIIHFSVNGNEIGGQQLSKSGEALISHNFPEKGKHTVMAELKDKSGSSMRNNVNLRIVDYREEIIRLYKTFLQHLNNCNVVVERDTTAREVESLLISSGHFDRECVHSLVACFEETEYSDHSITRNNYETMYLSLKGLNIDA